MPNIRPMTAALRCSELQLSSLRTRSIHTIIMTSHHTATESIQAAMQLRYLYRLCGTASQLYRSFAQLIPSIQLATFSRICRYSCENLSRPQIAKRRKTVTDLLYIKIHREIEH